MIYLSVDPLTSTLVPFQVNLAEGHLVKPEVVRYEDFKDIIENVIDFCQVRAPLVLWSLLSSYPSFYPLLLPSFLFSSFLSSSPSFFPLLLPSFLFSFLLLPWPPLASIRLPSSPFASIFCQVSFCFFRHLAPRFLAYILYIWVIQLFAFLTC